MKYKVHHDGNHIHEEEKINLGLKFGNNSSGMTFSNEFFGTFGSSEEVLGQGILLWGVGIANLGEVFVEERLDRALASSPWRFKFVGTYLQHVFNESSDHVMILSNTKTEVSMIKHHPSNLERNKKNTIKLIHHSAEIIQPQEQWYKRSEDILHNFN
ncbi:hypothetical protein ACH5RR_009341 [Cinchona calisaya]|uniref:Uncharacterized protein n=1 Tax=Cinchona calisaya TaxID=153742 RepID=A0ABD3AEE9_9GENT